MRMCTVLVSHICSQGVVRG